MAKVAWTWLTLENRSPRDGRGNVTVVKASQTRPGAYPDQRLVRVRLTIPDDFFDEPEVEVVITSPDRTADVRGVQD